ncbi:uncharacterized protein DUF58 [Brevirhabdus pacifica]|nr:uncharacterized protein DUF58 [Brevirhabdus pacifica]
MTPDLPPETSTGSAPAGTVSHKGLRSDAEAAAGAFPALLADARQLAATVILGAHGRRRAGAGDEFWQYRPANVSDGARQIDWRRSARSEGQAFVRQTEWQAAQSVMLWVDDGRSMDFSGDPDRPAKSDRARLLALAAAILLIRGGERVGLLGMAERPRTGETQLLRLARALVADSPPGDHATPAARAIPTGSRALFVSDFLGDPERLRQVVGQAADRGVSGVLLQVLDPVEEAFPFQGRTIFESMSGQLRHETLKASGLRGRYLERLAERKALLADLAHDTGWRYRLHHTGDSAQAALLWLYGALERVR